MKTAPAARPEEHPDQDLFRAVIRAEREVTVAHAGRINFRPEDQPRRDFRGRMPPDQEAVAVVLGELVSTI